MSLARKRPAPKQIIIHHGTVREAIARDTANTQRNSLLVKVSGVPEAKRPDLLRIKTYHGNVKQGKQELARERKRFSIEAHKAKTDTRDKRVNRISKYYATARKWFSRRGKISVEGYEKVSFEAGKKEIFVTINGKRTRVVTEYDGRKITRIFHATDGSNRLLLVRNGGKRFDPEQGNYRLSLSVKTRLPEKFEKAKEEPLIEARVRIYPKERTKTNGGIAFLKSFGWSYDYQFYTEPISPGKTRAPEFIKKKGFGIFLDALLRQTFFREGVTKAFAQVENNPVSQQFAEYCGLRAPTDRELRLAEQVPIYMETDISGKSSERPFNIGEKERFEGNISTIMVLDIPKAN